jgi:CDP-diacylglycerol---serine O-phosphatidyltransferase
MKRHIPNFITLLNLASGFAAIIYIFNDQFITAAWLVLLAMVFDFTDGFAAKLLKAYSDMGKELDSLADVVSFGVVPGLFIYRLASGAFNLPPLVIVVISVLVPMAAALRLAKFNTDADQKETFKGLPTPAAALAVVSPVLAGSYGSQEIFTIINLPEAYIITAILVAVLMVSPLRLLSLKFSSVTIRENGARYILIILSVASLATLGMAGVVLIIPLYLVVSVLSQLFR